MKAGINFSPSAAYFRVDISLNLFQENCNLHRLVLQIHLIVNTSAPTVIYIVMVTMVDTL